jgi:hypothetical protein
MEILSEWTGELEIFAAIVLGAASWWSLKSALSKWESAGRDRSIREFLEKRAKQRAKIAAGKEDI